MVRVSALRKWAAHTPGDKPMRKKLGEWRRPIRGQSPGKWERDPDLHLFDCRHLSFALPGASSPQPPASDA